MKTKRIIILVIITVFITSLILFQFFYYREYPIKLHLYEAYSIDASDYRDYKQIHENTPFTYFFLLYGYSGAPSDRIVNYVYNNHKMLLPDELVTYIASSEKQEYVLISVGRELTEVKYKYLPHYYDWVTSEAIVTFGEEYHDNMMYVYFFDKQLYFLGEYYYIINDNERVYLGTNLDVINKQLQDK